MSVILHDVPHVRQRESWDCGLACTWMALRALQGLENMEAAQTFQQTCDQQGFGKSVWTIDLAHLLAQYGVLHQFFTETLGVDPSYADQPYYKTEFESATCRINSLFGKAEDLGINIGKRFVTLQQLYDHINDNGIAIVLVDSNIINRKRRWHSSAVRFLKFSCFCCFHGTDENQLLSYAGHYIVVCGYDKETNQILYKDPAQIEDLSVVTASTFEAARKAHGTDCDIILLKLRKDGNTSQ
ncbi:protein GUCD1-like [Corticium candelabrum]|uniref:protein GUCD1-like n=1 Tax=Corticium candelabrum TaxID=121492 RepID=UPI002E25775A|nr:protein GUCD1-like [Corticium candelabrum]